MGRDKAFLELNGRTLLQHALDLARCVTANIFIVGPSSKFGSFGPVLEDVLPGRGPLAGIHAALKATTSEINLILALDTPFVSAAFIQYLAAEARTTNAAVTYPLVSGQSQPLCAVYRRSFLPVAEESLQQGHNKIDPLFALVPCRVIDDSELMRLGFDAGMFDNLNTPKDWEAARLRGSANS